VFAKKKSQRDEKAKDDRRREMKTVKWIPMLRWKERERKNEAIEFEIQWEINHHVVIAAENRSRMLWLWFWVWMGVTRRVGG